MLTKTFLGLTVSCARCHDHKFDAISTKDYYSLFGLLEGSAYRQVRFDGQVENRATLPLNWRNCGRKFPKPFTKACPPRRNEAQPSKEYLAWRNEAKAVLDFADPNTPFLPGRCDLRFGSLDAAGSFTLKATRTVQLEERNAAALRPILGWVESSTGQCQRLRPSRANHPCGLQHLRSNSFILEKKSLYYLVRGGGSAFAAVNDHTVISGPLHWKNDRNVRIPNAARLPLGVSPLGWLHWPTASMWN